MLGRDAQSTNCCVIPQCRLVGGPGLRAKLKPTVRDAWTLNDVADRMRVTIGGEDMRTKAITTRRGFLEALGGFAASSWGISQLNALEQDICAATYYGPICLDPDNPHYFSFQGKPRVLVGSGEHYGAVLNTKFDYSRYLETLAKAGMNHTRLFSGAYREVPGDFHIVQNTLAPDAKNFLCPWARSGTPGAVDGLNKFDLGRWDEAYSRRLVDFIATASRHEVAVEVNLFCPFYEDSMWSVSPLNSRNNINGVGDLSRTDVYALKDRRLQEVQDDMARHIISALANFDNFYFEICNEPYFGGVTLEWQQHIAEVIADAEGPLAKHHLISQNISNGSQPVTHPDPLVSIFNFHYSRPPDSVALNYELNKAIGMNETGFDGADDAPYRIQGWDFLVAGGSLYSNLDYSFVAGHEDGTFNVKRVGGGGLTLRRQLNVLRQFMEGLQFAHMAPAPGVVKRLTPAGASVRVLAEPGRSYAVYLHHGRPAKKEKPGAVPYVVDSNAHREKLAVDLPRNSYVAEWIDTKTGYIEKDERFDHEGGVKILAAPEYAEDIALRILAVPHG